MSDFRRSICILALSPIAEDGRVLRQIRSLGSEYALTVIGYGEPHPEWQNNENIRWVSLGKGKLIVTAPSIGAVWADLKDGRFQKLRQRIPFEISRFVESIALSIGQHLPIIYDCEYALRWQMNRSLSQALAIPHDAYHANDWDTVPFAYKAAQKQNAALIVDLHEYAPRHFEHLADWPRKKRRIVYFLEKYVANADWVTTVAPSLADEYAKHFLFEPSVILNTPYQISVSNHAVNPEEIRLIHHGVASALRKPEVMIDAIALCQERYSLHFMLMPSPYVRVLRDYAKRVAPGRVFFHDSVSPEAIAKRLAEFDVGFNYIPPATFNYLHCLPNKFFEGITAGLAICIGPSPSMQAIVEQYRLGCVAPSFEPTALAATLNGTTTQEWTRMRTAAHQAAQHLNAEAEMQKIRDLYDTLLSEKA